MDPAMMRKSMAEFLGTFWLTFAGVGSVVFSRGEAGYLGVALAFGLTVVTMAYAIGHISGCHLNPAVTIGLVASGRMNSKDAGPYIVAQIAGGIFAALMIFVIMKTNYGSDFVAKGNMGANDYKKILGGLLSEIVLTFMFLMIILGATSKRAPAAFAGLVIGLGLTLIHLVGMGLTGVSVNPARSIGVALFSRGDELKHLWVFIIAPPIGAVLAGFCYKMIDPEG